MFNDNNKKKNKIRLKKIISFLISYSLIFNNLLYASSVVIFDNNKETKIYNLEEDEGAIIIDIAKSFKKISLNIFKLFNTENKKVVINNSNRRTKSKLLNGKEIEANDNYNNDDNNNIADTIVFLLKSEDNDTNTILSSTSFEVLGTVNNFMFLGSNNIITKGLKYTDSISKLTLAAGKYNNNSIIISANSKLSLLPTEDENHLALDASEIDELNLLAREINIFGETIVKGSLAITTGLEKNNNDNKPKYSFQTSSFGNIQASSIELINLEENTDINLVNTSIVTTIGNIDINLKKGNLLLSNNKIISEQSTLAIKANNLNSNNSSTLLSAKDMILTVQNALVNDDKSIIHTEAGGNIIIQTQDLKNTRTSTIHSGGELRVNGKLLENIGVDDQEKNPKHYGSAYRYDLQRYSLGTGRVIRDDWATIYPMACEAFIEKQENTGKEPQLNSEEITNRSVLEILLTTSQSKIIAIGNITINSNVIKNFGSLILSGDNILVNSTGLVNERTSFDFSVRFVGARYWKTKGWYEWEYRNKWVDKYSFTENRHFYSNTPSIIYGKNVDLNIKNIVNDPILQEAFHIKDSEKKIPSFIYSENNLNIKADSITDGGIISSAKNKKNINSPVIKNISSSHTSSGSEEFKYTLSSLRENIMISKIMSSEKFRKKLSNASNLKIEELVKLLEKSAETIITQESNEAETEKKEIKVRVLLYNQDNDVRGYSFSSGSETRIIGINVKNHDMTDSIDLMETIFHECYDEKKHTNNEEAAVRFGQYARELWDAVVRMNKFTYLENGSNFTEIKTDDPKIIGSTKETEEIYQKIKTLGDKAGIFNEAKIMARPIDLVSSICKQQTDESLIKKGLCLPNEDSIIRRLHTVHYEVFFEDEIGGHIGFHGDGSFLGFGGGKVRPDEEINLGKYNQVVVDNLDDRIMREALGELTRENAIKDYNFLFHNCQHFAIDDFMLRYNQRITQRMLGEIPAIEIINPTINRDFNLLTSSFMKDRIMTNPNSLIREQKISILEHLNQFKPSPTVNMYKDPFLKDFIEMRDRNNIPNMNWQQNRFPYNNFPYNNNPNVPPIFQNFPRDFNRPGEFLHVDLPNLNDMIRGNPNQGFGNRPGGF